MSAFRAYPRADAARPPSPWWYYGRALYVSRRDYFKIYCAILFGLGIPLVWAGWYFDSRFLLDVAFAVGGVSLVYLGYSLFGMFRMYGPPSKGYLRQLFARAGVRGAAAVADLHVGTYRHSFALAELLPGATVYSVDCWNVPGQPHEEAIADVRALEPVPEGVGRVEPLAATDFALPLADASCDLVTFGFGTHEIPTGGPREKLFAEAERVLKPGGKVLIFEHGRDFHNTIVFGPVIGHVTPRTQWLKTLAVRFGDVGYDRSSAAVDLLWATKGAATGTVTRPIPPEPRWLATWKILRVILSVATLVYVAGALLAGTQLYWTLLGIAVLGLAWPWLMIGVALAADTLTRTPARRPTPARA